MIEPQHEYIRKKRLTMYGCRNLRIDREGWLLVPLSINGSMISLQRISPKGEKRFATGAPTRGGYYWIERPKACVTILCEGFATGVTIFESVQHSRVCVAFSAANMIEVAKRLDWSGMCVVAGDNDWEKPCPWCIKQGSHEQNRPDLPRPEQCRCNPGWTAAMKASEIIKCGYVPAVGPGTDWNDTFCMLLAESEDRSKDSPHPPSPYKLRQRACAPISDALMKAAKFVKC